ncbi:MAG TPA: glycosyltransferase family 87 protein, partial [Chthonomonadales bacterium]|nr:glycosyltransferase family 87 protein [Chthonomonadales bacterium]
PRMANMFLHGVPICVNLPTTLFLLLPVAMLPWGPAHLLWLTLTAIGLILAAYLSWSLAERYSSGASLFLICFLLANCEGIFLEGDAAGLVVSLCAIAVWCFLEERFVVAGVLCLAISLAIKPHDAGLVWLYFLLAGGIYRKRALQTLAITVVLGLAATLWISRSAPNWIPEIRANLAATSSHGDIRDPGPDSITSHTAAAVIDLQGVLSNFRDDPHFYNPVSYLICGPLLLLWTIRTVRSPSSPTAALVALAAVVPLSMLFTYHRPHDAKLLLLTVPVCMMLWMQGGRTGRLALVFTSAAILFTADIPLAILQIIAAHFHVVAVGLLGKTMTVALARPAALILLAMSIFYLWVYVRRTPGEITAAFSGSSDAIPIAPRAT